MQPLDVVLVRPPLDELGDLAAPRRVVGAERLLGHPHDARVEQRVVVREHEAVVGRAEPEQGEVPQRRGVELEAGEPVVDEELGAAGRPARRASGGAGRARPAARRRGRRPPGSGSSTLGPAELRAHDRVAVGDPLPRRPHARRRRPPRRGRRRTARCRRRGSCPRGGGRACPAAPASAGTHRLPTVRAWPNGNIGTRPPIRT